MRDVILKLAIAAMLFVSMEGTAESIDDTSFHQTHHSHAEDGAEWFPDSDGNDHEGESCEHFCHVHVVALTSYISVPNLPKSHGFLLVPSAHTIHRATAPPTPPPNI